MLIADMAVSAPDMGIYFGCTVALITAIAMVMWIVSMIRKPTPDPAKEYITRGEHNEATAAIRTKIDSMENQFHNMALDVRELVTMKRMECHFEVNKKTHE